MKTAIVIGFLIVTTAVASASNWQFVMNNKGRGCYIDTETLNYPRSKKTLGFETGPDKNFIKGWVKCDAIKQEFYIDCAGRRYDSGYEWEKSIPPDSLWEAISKSVCP
ncbi:MAG: hypothetical protein HZB62_10165 [Nitrospirae bacterium]|nr:hypothetical protein [Nitrospirota bacterium]